MIRFFLIGVLFSVRIVSAQPVIEKVEPPNWWTGMKLNSIQLMLYGTDLNDISVNFEPAGIGVISVEEAENDSYAFVNIEIPAGLPPAEYKMLIQKNGERSEKIFPVYVREEGIRHQGFGPSDVIYLIMPDRFINGDPSNDNASGFIDSLNKQNPDGRHGGDIQGIINKLDYINKLGITTLWLTPLVENNTPMSYHGYGATDFYNIDPRQGNNELYKQLVSEAHKKGLKVIIDHVSNHFHRNHRWMNQLPMNSWIHGSPGNHLPANHNKMVFVDPYRDTVSIKHVSEGWFTNYLVDLNQANEFVKNYIIQNTIWWLEYSGADGIREDTYPYSDQQFLAEWAEVILSEYPQLNIVGEVWTGEPAFLSGFQKGSTVRGFDSNLPSLTDFGLRDRFYDFLTGKGTLFNIYETLTKDYLYQDPSQLLTFIDNHDIARGLFYANGDKDKMKTALLILLTTRGIPQLLYGTETGIPGGESHGTLRFDFPDNPSEINKDYFNYIQQLLSFRKQYTALSQGRLTHFPPEKGIYVYFKESEDERFMIVVNENTSTQDVPLNTYEKYLKNSKIVDIFSGAEISSDHVTINAMSGNIYKLD